MVGTLRHALLPLLLVVTASAQLDTEFQRVTCNSAIKLTHVPSGFKLHSHGVNYGSGSGQQSVTCFPTGSDPNSYFVVRPAYMPDLDSKARAKAIENKVMATCPRGTPILCGAVVRMQHQTTSKHLHSHLHMSPLSGGQEVSAYDGLDSGDNWRIDCLEAGDYWVREKRVRLVHVDTGRFLSSSVRHQFRHTITGQLEVAAVNSKSEDNVWIAQEGIYFADFTQQ